MKSIFFQLTLAQVDIDGDIGYDTEQEIHCTTLEHKDAVIKALSNALYIMTHSED